MFLFKWIQNKTKEGKKLKKKKLLEDQEEQEEPDCEPPAPKKKKKKDKLAADQVNDHIDEATDMNGNSNGVETPKKIKKKNTEGDTEVSAMVLVWICSYQLGKWWKNLIKKHKCIFSGHAPVDQTVLCPLYNVISTFIFGFRKKGRSKRKQKQKPTDIPPQTPLSRRPSRHRPSQVKNQPVTAKKKRYELQTDCVQSNSKEKFESLCCYYSNCTLWALLASSREITVTTMISLLLSLLLYCY